LPTDYIALPAQARLCVLDGVSNAVDDVDTTVLMLTEMLALKDLYGVVKVNFYLQSLSTYVNNVVSQDVNQDKMPVIRLYEAHLFLAHGTQAPLAYAELVEPGLIPGTK
jgi:hypothetical protein